MYSFLAETIFFGSFAPVLAQIILFLLYRVITPSL